MIAIAVIAVLTQNRVKKTVSKTATSRKKSGAKKDLAGFFITWKYLSPSSDLQTSIHKAAIATEMAAPVNPMAGINKKHNVKVMAIVTA